MGSNTSKAVSEAAVQVQSQKNESEVNSDPRSPTPEISRTPLQGKGGSKHHITKNVDLRKTFENGENDERLIHNNPILTAVIKNHLQSYDPRSPTQDFERTPIVIGHNVEDLKIKNALRAQTMDDYGSPCLYDANDSNGNCAPVPSNPPDMIPKNLCEGFMNLTFNDTIKDVDEPLGSSTASGDSIEKSVTNHSIDKPTKLLETNFDYDEKFQECSDSIEDQKSQLSSENDSEAENELANIPKFKILSEDPRSPSVGIERTPIVVTKIEEEAKANNVEEMSDDTLIKVLQSTNAELIHAMTKPQGRHSEEILIYEDEANTLNNTPRKSKATSDSGSRTPLSCMKNKADAVHSRSKSAITLYGAKCENNAVKKVSHIPRLKSLTKQKGSSISLRNISNASGATGDCENTPPHSHRDKWDKDTSIVL